MASQSVTLDLWIEAEKDTRVSVRETEHAPIVNLPASQITIEERKGNVAQVTMPEWLATDRGFFF